MAETRNEQGRLTLGLDASAQFETRKASPVYRAHGKEIEPLRYAHDVLGVAVLRLRLWVDPYDGQGEPYQGGTTDYATFLALAKEGRDLGYKILLDFHYSDFWTDPSKQSTPKAWRGLSLEAMCAKISEYTVSTLNAIQNEGIELYGVQIGNEITNGMLWPLGRLHDSVNNAPRQGYENLCPLLHSASTAVRKACPNAKIVIHLERSFDQAIYREFFDAMKDYGVDYDVIGMSYYPYWHGTFDEFFANVDFIKGRYHKPAWIVETAYGFTLDPAYVDGEEWKPWVTQSHIDEVHARLPYPISKEGQKKFIEELIRRCKEHGVEEIYYWEPFWLPLPGLNWASFEGEKYILQTEKPLHNEWMNQCLFDYEGNANEAFFAYTLK